MCGVKISKKNSFLFARWFRNTAMSRSTPSSQASNLIFRKFVETKLKCVYISGVVAKPVGKFYSAESYQYQLLNCNVNLLKIIQIGLTFMDENGNPAPNCATWQFNFKFRIS